MNAPMGGGGYFKLFCGAPSKQSIKRCVAALAYVNFHPWEFDVEQQRLPLAV
jgi:hypothetical protein